MGNSRRDALWLYAKLAAVCTAGMFGIGAPRAAPNPPDPLIRFWRERHRLIEEVASLRRRAGQDVGTAAHPEFAHTEIARREARIAVMCAGHLVEIAPREARISALEARIVKAHAMTLAGLAVQARLMTEFCELGALADESDLILARNIESGLERMADLDGV